MFTSGLPFSPYPIKENTPHFQSEQHQCLEVIPQQLRSSRTKTKGFSLTLQHQAQLLASGSSAGTEQGARQAELIGPRLQLQ